MDKFTQEVKKIGNSLMIIIPANVAKFSDIKEGDIIKVNFEKVKS